MTRNTRALRLRSASESTALQSTREGPRRASISAGSVTPLLVLAWATCAIAGPVGPEFRVNTYTPYKQGGTNVAANGSGSFVVVWMSSIQDGNWDGVFAQRYSPLGVAEGAEFQVNTETQYGQKYPAVAMDPAGNFVIVWESDYQDGDDGGVYGQLFDASGAAVGSEFRVNTQTEDNQSAPDVAMDAAGNFVVVWRDTQYSSAGISGQRFDFSGSPLGGAFRVDTYPGGSKLNPSVAMDGAGNFVVAWWSYFQDGGTAGIYGQRFDAAGTPLGTEFQINTYTIGSQQYPCVAMNGTGDFVVTWHSYEQDGDSGGIYGQRYDASGTPLGTEFQINTYTIGNQSNRSVTMDAAGNFVAAWTSVGQDGDAAGAFLQRFDSMGNPYGEELQANTYTTDNQWVPAVAMDDLGYFVVAWESLEQDGDSGGIYAQRFEFEDPPPPVPLHWVPLAIALGVTALAVLRRERGPGIASRR